MTTVELWSPPEFWTRARSCRRHQGRDGEKQPRTGWPLAEGLGPLAKARLHELGCADPRDTPRYQWDTPRCQ